MTIDLAFWAGTATGLIAAVVAYGIATTVTVHENHAPAADDGWLTTADRELLDEEIA